MERYMHKLATLANNIVKGTGVTFTRVVSNAMASNYYIDYKGEEGYIDQYTLQDWFTDDGCEYTYSADGQKTCNEHKQTMHVMDNGCDLYGDATDKEKAQALAELALGNFNLL